MRQHDDPLEQSIVIESGDALTNSLLNYLWSGRLTAVQPLWNVLAKKAEDMFFEKLTDPNGAAVAGYYLLRIGAFERLHNWPNNFAKWFSWFPDSGVIHAWQIIRDPKLKDYDLALDLLLKAERGGIPVYTEGLRLLYDGLRLFEKRNPEARSAATRVAQYIRAMNTNSPLTQIFGRGPASPDTSPVFDKPPFRGAKQLFIKTQLGG